MKTNIEFLPPHYKVTTSFKYPSIKEAKRFICSVYAHHIREKGYLDVSREAHELHKMYSIKCINNWTLKVALSDGNFLINFICFFIPKWISKRMFKYHIFVTYIVRLSLEDLSNMKSDSFDKISFKIIPFIDNRISEFSFLWEDMLNDIYIECKDEYNYEIIYKSNGKKLREDKKYHKLIYNLYDETYYETLLKKLIQEGIEVV